MGVGRGLSERAAADALGRGAAAAAGRETFLTCELMAETRGTFTYFLAASPSELDPVLSRFVEEGILKDVVFSVIGG